MSKTQCKGLIWHTDRGSQYASNSHRALLNSHGIIQSMSRKRIKSTLKLLMTSSKYYYHVSLKSINQVGFMKENVARSIAIWLSRKIGRYSLKEVVAAFQYRSYSGVAVLLYRFEKRVKGDVELMKTLHQLTEQVELLCNKKRCEDASSDNSLINKRVVV